jgi:tmRNA-binding protein
MPSHTHVSWVIQYKEEDKTSLVPYDMYFEVDQCAFVTETQREKKKKEDRSIDRKYDVHRNIDDPFIKGEIIEFLSHLF